MPGEDMVSFGGESIYVWISVPADQGQFEIGFIFRWWKTQEMHTHIGKNAHLGFGKRVKITDNGSGNDAQGKRMTRAAIPMISSTKTR